MFIRLSLLQEIAALPQTESTIRSTLYILEALDNGDIQVVE